MSNIFVYDQKTGQLSYNDTIIGIGYSGQPPVGINNPAKQDVPNVGPLPKGTYTIGPVHNPSSHLGPLAMPLYPDSKNNMFGRMGFFIHGDNFLMNQSASNGCIVMNWDIRHKILMIIEEDHANTLLVT